MKPCPNCGQMVADTANFCHMCGERIPSLPPPPDPVIAAPPDERRVPWLLVASIGLAVLAGMGIYTVLAGADDAPAPTDSAQPSPSPTADSPAPTGTPQAEAVLSSTGTVLITVEVANCAGCAITAVPGTSRWPAAPATCAN